MSYWKEIYTFSELESLILDNVIRESFSVNTTEVNALKNVKEIRIEQNGVVYFKELIDIDILESIYADFSFSGNLQSLRNLKYIGGSFRFEAPLKSLENLEEINGDLRPLTNDLENLGKLKVVGGTADFRGMIHLFDLTPLSEVGGNLNLVKSLEGKYIGLEKIKVRGRIIYWNKEPKYWRNGHFSGYFLDTLF